MLSLPPRRSGPPRQPVCDGPCCLHLHGCRLGLRSYHFRGHLCVRLRYGLETRPHPTDEAVERLQKVGFPSPCAPSYRALAFPLVGFPPTEHASLSWTHNRTYTFPRIRLSTSTSPTGGGTFVLGSNGERQHLLALRTRCRRSYSPSPGRQSFRVHRWPLI